MTRSMHRSRKRKDSLQNSLRDLSMVRVGTRKRSAANARDRREKSASQQSS